MADKKIITGAVAAIGASLCCITPVLAVLAGSTGLASSFSCDTDEEGKVSFWYSKTFLAIVTIFAAVMLSFPYWGDTFIKSDKY